MHHQLLHYGLILTSIQSKQREGRPAKESDKQKEYPALLVSVTPRHKTLDWQECQANDEIHDP
jgi:hypothetical protein